MSYLVLTRHGESQFNAKSLWTGIWDVPLTEKGKHEAVLMAHAVKDIKPHFAYTSKLSRAADTLDIILKTNRWKPSVQTARELNERDYGDLTGMNKWAVEERYGKEQFLKWRRGWDESVPGGETLKDVSARAIPYFRRHILPDLKRGNNTLVTAHGNTLRALIKHLDNLSDKAVQDLEMPFGQVIIYTLSRHGDVESKIIRHIMTTPPPA